VDVHKYLVAGVSELLSSGQFETVEEIAEVAVGAVLDHLEEPPTPENIVDHGIEVWLEMKNSPTTTIKDVKDFIARAEKMGLEDSTHLDGFLSVQYSADPKEIWGDK